MKKPGMKTVFVEIPAEIHKQIKQAAIENDLDISKLLRILIGQFLAREQNNHLRSSYDETR